jgi:hypothetical protein
MGLIIRLEKEDGSHVEELVDYEDLLADILPDGDDPTSRLLRYVDPYGNTIFNRPQMSDLLAELRALRERSSVDRQRELIKGIQKLAEECQRTTHRYLKFYGD